MKLCPDTNTLILDFKHEGKVGSRTAKEGKKKTARSS